MKCTAKTLVKLGGCPGVFEPSLGLKCKSLILSRVLVECFESILNVRWSAPIIIISVRLKRNATNFIMLKFVFDQPTKKVAFVVYFPFIFILCILSGI